MLAKKCLMLGVLLASAAAVLSQQLQDVPFTPCGNVNGQTPDAPTRVQSAMCPGGICQFPRLGEWLGTVHFNSRFPFESLGLTVHAAFPALPNVWMPIETPFNDVCFKLNPPSSCPGQPGPHSANVIAPIDNDQLPAARILARLFATNHLNQIIACAIVQGQVV